MQIRTQLQHAWATAVEAVGIFTKQALKSNQGSADWLRFFALMGSAIAAMENSHPVPNTPTNKDDLILEIDALAEKLSVANVLRAYSASINYIGSMKGAKYFLLSLDPETGKVEIWNFGAKQSETANQKYIDLEGNLLDGSTKQIVLVSTDNVTALKRAYPNYFLDTNVFGGLVTKVLKGEFPNPLPQKTNLVAA